LLDFFGSLVSKERPASRPLSSGKGLFTSRAAAESNVAVRGASSSSSYDVSLIFDFLQVTFAF
jgi:hypothetical protein